MHETRWIESKDENEYVKVANELASLRWLRVRARGEWVIDELDVTPPVEVLDLKRCQSLVDVSALGGVKKLDLSKCTSLVDVSALGGVTKLDLS